MNFLMVIMVISGIARGRVRTITTATTESRKMAAIIQIVSSLTETCSLGFTSEDVCCNIRNVKFNIPCETLVLCL